jgi:hypothetical protein
VVLAVVGGLFFLEQAGEDEDGETDDDEEPVEVIVD